jgi:hypothetical protein
MAKSGPRMMISLDLSKHGGSDSINDKIRAYKQTRSH